MAGQSVGHELGDLVSEGKRFLAQSPFVVAELPQPAQEPRRRLGRMWGHARESRTSAGDRNGPGSVRPARDWMGLSAPASKPASAPKEVPRRMTRSHTFISASTR